MFSARVDVSLVGGVVEAKVGEEGQQHEEDEDRLQQHETRLDNQSVFWKNTTNRKCFKLTWALNALRSV